MSEKFIADLSGLKKEILEDIKKAREELKKDQGEKLKLEKKESGERFVFDISDLKNEIIDEIRKAKKELKMEKNKYEK